MGCHGYAHKQIFAIPCHTYHDLYLKTPCILLSLIRFLATIVYHYNIAKCCHLATKVYDYKQITSYQIMRRIGDHRVGK